MAYLNEKEQQKAAETLLSWLQHHPRFHALQLPTAAELFGPSEDALAEGIVDAGAEAAAAAAASAATASSTPSSAPSPDTAVARKLLQALQAAQTHARMTGALPGSSLPAADSTSSEISTLLGVLHNLLGGRNAAAAAFQDALSARPQDYALWNKHGATLANLGQRAESLSSFSKALLLRPGYARGWLNAALSHHHLQDSRAAAEAYARALQAAPRAQHIWPLLRMVLARMGRYDLVAATEERDAEGVLKMLRES